MLGRGFSDGLWQEALLIGKELKAVSQINWGKSHQFVCSVGCREEDDCIGIATGSYMFWGLLTRALRRSQQERNKVLSEGI